MIEYRGKKTKKPSETIESLAVGHMDGTAQYAGSNVFSAGDLELLEFSECFWNVDSFPELKVELSQWPHYDKC